MPGNQGAVLFGFAVVFGGLAYVVAEVFTGGDVFVSIIIGVIATLVGYLWYRKQVADEAAEREHDEHRE